MHDRFTVAYPPDLRTAEASAVKRRREKVAALFGETERRADVEGGMLPTDAVGVALSGGGIRSRTFCLGVFQVLARHGLLRHVDFLPTVSGGGFFGVRLVRNHALQRTRRMRRAAERQRCLLDRKVLRQPACVATM